MLNLDKSSLVASLALHDMVSMEHVQECLQHILTQLDSMALQVALGELTYESEARDRNRIDLKAARAEAASLQTLLASTQVRNTLAFEGWHLPVLKCGSAGG